MTTNHSSGWKFFEVTFKETARSRRTRTLQQFSPSIDTIAERFASMWEDNEGIRPVVLSVRELNKQEEEVVREGHNLQAAPKMPGTIIDTVVERCGGGTQYSLFSRTAQSTIYGSLQFVDAKGQATRWTKPIKTNGYNGR